MVLRMKTKSCGPEFNERSGFWTGLRAVAADIFRQHLAALDEPEPAPLFKRRASPFHHGPTASQQIDAMCKQVGRETYARDIADMQHGGFASNAKALAAVAFCRPLQIYRLMR
jgi:hypothetical protein